MIHFLDSMISFPCLIQLFAAQCSHVIFCSESTSISPSLMVYIPLLVCIIPHVYIKAFQSLLPKVLKHSSHIMIVHSIANYLVHLACQT